MTGIKTIVASAVCGSGIVCGDVCELVVGDGAMAGVNILGGYCVSQTVPVKFSMRSLFTSDTVPCPPTLTPSKTS